MHAMFIFNDTASKNIGRNASEQSCALALAE